MHCVEALFGQVVVGYVHPPHTAQCVLGYECFKGLVSLMNATVPDVCLFVYEVG